MSPNTHCLPTGSLGTGELPVNSITISNTNVSDPGVGNRRGLVVFQHGLPVGVNPQTVFPIPVPNLTLSPGLSAQLGDFEAAVVADNWIFWYPPYQEDFYSPQANPGSGVLNDVNNDTAHGTRYLNSSVRWYKHIQSLALRTYGVNPPIILAGWSWGANRTLWLAANHVPGLAGFISHEPLCLPENAIIPAVPGWNAANWSGLDLPSSYLTDANTVSTLPPGIIGYGTNDQIAGYQTPGGSLPTNNTDAILTACSNGGLTQITRNTTTDTHEFTGTPQGAGNDAATYAAWIATNLDHIYPISF